MQAIVVRPPHPGAELVDVAQPIRASGELLIRVIEGGVCGTDRDIVHGDYGTPPTDRPELILGHENLGEVVESPEGADSLRPGSLVVATVRRGCGECEPCRLGRSDYCTTGRFTERGIKGRDGYFAQYYTEIPEYLVEIPKRLRSVAVLLEPLSVVEKAVRVGERVSGRRGPMPPNPDRPPARALVTGTGAVGLLAAMLLRTRGYDVTTVDRHGGDSAVGDITRQIGASHVNVADGLDALSDRRFDLILEASGSVLLDLELPNRLAPNGTLVLTGIPSTTEAHAVTANGSRLRAIVLENQAIVGSVNAHRAYFEEGVRSLARFRRQFGPSLDELIAARVPWTGYAEVLQGGAHAGVKAVLTIAA